ncbi:MAG: pyruvate formate-lyase-activating protein [Candidatus Omnitrophota bacterium]|nr:pyruvate formate-lyase-activating protein [Candidatus Omnitrophota bacterium]
MKQCSKKSRVGRIHSIESFATQDGPGIRFLLFMQGCVAGCLYCQNPDTWNLKGGFDMSAEEALKKVKRCMPYIKASNGGITVSGGEPLLQMEFLVELFRLCRMNNIHTAVDTSAFYYKRNSKLLRKLISLTDLFIVDIKAAREKLHKKITSRPLGEVLDLLKILESEKKACWIRYVLVPKLNDSKKDMQALKKILAGLSFCEKFEFLPYHTLGKHKWEYMKLKYPLGNTPPATARDIKKALAFIK